MGRYEARPVSQSQDELWEEAIFRVLESINQADERIVTVIKRPERVGGPHVVIIVETPQ